MKFPDNIRAQMLPGKLYYENEDYQAALEHFIIIKDKMGSNTDLDYWIILCYRALGIPDEAEVF
ncbi:hypothetical protein [Herbinix luporum]|jgi:lipopolysaccharide biosynthesis regulator YciM|uniref:hypothetical protein n=1 Tax=Herbinix luporum TaxID=1679721 RepID=UPI0017514CC8|nr:hypothetical protein [Herbinix luporum]HHT57272.1 hypothetical protein [Herbinix luporum]